MTGARESTPMRLVVAFTVLGGLLRFATLDVQSIWLDESATILLVHRGFSGMLSHLSASESSPPLYYVLVWAWTHVFGAGPLGFRSFSALTGTLTIPVMYAAGRQISPRVGTWAAALTSVSPAMYYYSQEARAYGLWILLAAAAYVLWQRALQAPDGRRLALWAGVSILAVLTHYFTAFLFIPEALILIARLGWRRVWAPVGAIVLVGLALAPLAASQIGSNKVHWIEESSLVSRLGETAKLYVVGVYGPLEILSAVLGALLIAIALAMLLRRGAQPERAGARDAAIVATAAIVLPALPAATHVLDVFDGRNVIAIWVPFALLMACAFGAAQAGRAVAPGRAVTPGRAATLSGVALCAISLAVIAATDAIPAYQRDDWRGVAHALARPTAPSTPAVTPAVTPAPTPRATRIVVAERYASEPLSIYLSSLQALTAPTVATRELAFVGLRTRSTGGSPRPPVVPRSAPHGFRLAGVTTSETFAVSTFTAARATSVSIAAMRRLLGEANAELILQR